MAAFLLRRLGLMVLTLFILSLIVFFAGQILPGDPGRATLGNLASQSSVQALDQQLGVNRPLLTRYLSWIGGLLHGNMGTSYAYRTAVEPFIRAALINSLKLAVLAFVIVVPLGILGGVISALHAGRATDRVISVTGLSLSTVPEFVSGIVLLVVFGVELKWLPVTASAGAGASPLQPVPAPDLAGYTARFCPIRLHCPYGQGGDHRSAELRLHADRRAEGPARSTVIRRHVLRNSLLPTITVIATQTGYLIGGLVVVETLFNYQGLGNLIYKAAVAHDFPMLEAGVLIIGVVYVLATLAADLLLTWLNPRLRAGGDRMSGPAAQPGPSPADPDGLAPQPGRAVRAGRRPRPDRRLPRADRGGRGGRGEPGHARPGGSCCCAGRRSSWARRSSCSGWPARSSATSSRRTARWCRTCSRPTPPRPGRTGSAPTRSAGTCCPGSSSAPGTS